MHSEENLTLRMLLPPPPLGLMPIEVVAAPHLYKGKSSGTDSGHEAFHGASNDMLLVHGLIEDRAIICHWHISRRVRGYF